MYLSSSLGMSLTSAQHEGVSHVVLMSVAYQQKMPTDKLYTCKRPPVSPGHSLHQSHTCQSSSLTSRPPNRLVSHQQMPAGMTLSDTCEHTRTPRFQLNQHTPLVGFNMYRRNERTYAPGILQVQHGILSLCRHVHYCCVDVSFWYSTGKGVAQATTCQTALLNASHSSIGREGL